MRRVLWLLAAGAIVVAIAWYLANLPGQITVAAFGLVIEARAGVAVLAAVLLLLLLLGVLRLLLGILGLPRRWGMWRSARRRARGEVAVTQALTALAAADPSAARRAAARARDGLGDTAQTLLLAAEAERLAGRDVAAEELYRTMAARPDAAFLGLRGLFRQAMAREDFAGAAELAGRAEAVHPGARWLHEERAALAMRTGDWSQALALAPPGPGHAALATAAAQAESNPERATSLAKRAWTEDRSFVPAALAYATRLRAAGRESRAQSVLAESWTQSPHPALADAALAGMADGLARVAAAKRLSAGAADHAETHLLLARETLAAGLAGEARRHLAAARAAGINQARLFLIQADLAATEGDMAAQRDALRQAALATPDPAWRCAACGAAHAAWHPVCPACHAPGQIAWGGPTRPALTAE